MKMTKVKPGHAFISQRLKCMCFVVSKVNGSASNTKHVTTLTVVYLNNAGRYSYRRWPGLNEARDIFADNEWTALNTC